jgi:hypothetical protein
MVDVSYGSMRAFTAHGELRTVDFAWGSLKDEVRANGDLIDFQSAPKTDFVRGRLAAIFDSHRRGDGIPINIGIRTFSPYVSPQLRTSSGGLFATKADESRGYVRQKNGCDSGDCPVVFIKEFGAPDEEKKRHLISGAIFWIGISFGVAYLLDKRR